MAGATMATNKKQAAGEDRRDMQTDRSVRDIIDSARTAQ